MSTKYSGKMHTDSSGPDKEVYAGTAEKLEAEGRELLSKGDWKGGLRTLEDAASEYKNSGDMNNFKNVKGTLGKVYNLQGMEIARAGKAGYTKAAVAFRKAALSYKDAEDAASEKEMREKIRKISLGIRENLEREGKEK